MSHKYGSRRGVQGVCIPTPPINSGFFHITSAVQKKILKIRCGLLVLK